MYVEIMLRSAAAMLLLLPACGSGGLMLHGVRCEQDGETALMRASSMGYTEVVVQLLDKGADVNAQNKVFGEAYGAHWVQRGGFSGRHRGQRGWLGDGCDTHTLVCIDYVCRDYASLSCCYAAVAACMWVWRAHEPRRALRAERLDGLDARQLHGPHRGGGAAAGQGRRRECSNQGIWRGVWCNISDVNSTPNQLKSNLKL